MEASLGETVSSRWNWLENEQAAKCFFWSWSATLVANGFRLFFECHQFEIPSTAIGCKVATHSLRAKQFE
eukprot:scaffold22560_cov135-Cylindrotheca_fusiformis.AAC.8